MLTSWLSVGWIGNDAISPIIGEHDPYIHVFVRVSIVVIETLNIYSLSHYIDNLLIYHINSSSGAYSSTSCHCPYDLYHACCHSYINCCCSANPYGNFCP